MTYLDHAATTPMHPAALEAMVAELGRTGNASSLHGPGRAARRTLEESRESLAAGLGARPNDVVLTSGGTEADNLAITGLYWARRTADPRRRRVVVSGVEHHAVLDPARRLEQHGAEIVVLPVDAEGVVDLAALAAELDRHAEEIALISVMWANNEIGTIQPVPAVVAAAREHGIPVHADAVQAVAHLDVDFAASGLDAMTVSGHKIGGPVGIGLLLVRRGLAVQPVLHGGGQERGLRPGTLDVPAARAFAVALERAVADRPVEAPRLSALRDRLLAGVLDQVSDAVVRGPRGAARLPANAHLTFPGCEADSLIYLLDSAGIACSTGSACQAGVQQPSHVLLA
ncbi:cysteine desulfurase family protein, partial [Actinotalea sp.]|uniref:cysteine desulfurase family protein n=1 Tax=Actinotalea sp. TaxID=1872145 RepID=UPI00356B60AF